MNGLLLRAVVLGTFPRLWILRWYFSVLLSVKRLLIVIFNTSLSIRKNSTQNVLVVTNRFYRLVCLVLQTKRLGAS